MRLAVATLSLAVLPSVALAAAHFSTETDVGAWKLRVFTNSVTDERSAILRLSASDELPDVDGRIEVFCVKGQDLRIRIVMPKSRNENHEKSEKLTRIRFDRFPVNDLQMSYLGYYIFARSESQNEAIMSELPKYSSMAIQYTPERPSEYSYGLLSFDIRNAARAFETLKPYCVAK